MGSAIERMHEREGVWMREGLIDFVSLNSRLERNTEEEKEEV